MPWLRSGTVVVTNGPTPVVGMNGGFAANGKKGEGKKEGKVKEQRRRRRKKRKRDETAEEMRKKMEEQKRRR